MVATAIIRHIDDLGRIVIPKEIRRSMKIREGDPLEIYVDHENEAVCFKRHHPNETVKEQLTRIIELNNYLPNEAINHLKKTVELLTEESEESKE